LSNVILTTGGANKIPNQDIVKGGCSDVFLRRAYVSISNEIAHEGWAPWCIGVVLI